MTAPICPSCLMCDRLEVRLLPQPPEAPRLWLCCNCGGEFDCPPRSEPEMRESTFEEWAEMCDLAEEQIRLRREGLIAVGDTLKQGRDRFWDGGDLEAQRARRRR